MLAAGVLKYLLGSAGLGFMWTRPGLSERLLPTQTGWFADQNIFEMDITDYSPSPTARRFQSGTPPVPAIYAGIAGLELMEEIGVAETRAHVTALNERLIAGVDELGGVVVTPRDPEQRGALVCIRSTDAPAARRRARRRRASSPRSATATCASRRMPTTPRKTSTRCSPPWPGTATYWPEVGAARNSRIWFASRSRFDLSGRFRLALDLPDIL